MICRNIKSKKAMTLMEVLISMVILGYLLFVIYASFVPAIRKMRIANAQSKSLQDALVAYQKLFSEISESTARSVTVTHAPSASYTKSISFLSSRPASFGGSPMPDADMFNQHTFTDGITWQKFVIFYPGTVATTNGNLKVLMRKEIPFNKGENVWRIQDDRVQGYINNNAYRSSVAALNIHDIEFTIPRYPAVIIDLTCSDYVGFRDGLKGANSVDIETDRFFFTICPRN